MTSPGKYLVELAQYLEEGLSECGRPVDCVDLTFGNVIDPPQLKGNCNLLVDVGFDQQPNRMVSSSTKQPLNQRYKDCDWLNRWAGMVRVTRPYEFQPSDCCHEHTAFVYEYANDVWVVGNLIQRWLKEETEWGESTKTQYVEAYNGGSVTTRITFSMLLCAPNCEELIAEEKQMKGILDALKK